VSSPERATLELLHELPDHETFQQVDDLFDGLNTLSPKRLTELLQSYRHVRTLPLFAWFAKRHSHPWTRRPDLAALNLGSGIRQVVKGGEVDPELRITVPKCMSRMVPR